MKVNYTITTHYNQYYRYDLPVGKEPAETVNRLFDTVMHNDKQALEQVIRILSSNIYYMVYSKVKTLNMDVIDGIDELMQIIQLEILQKAFRGFPEWVDEEGFYGYLLRLAEKQVKNYERKQRTYGNRENIGQEDYVFEQSNPWQYDDSAFNPEDKLISDEELALEQKILDIFVKVLMESNEKPYKVVTYCYAVLLPQLMKRSENVELLNKVNVISGRESSRQTSFYNEKDKCLEGEIARDSVVLLNWALDAMNKKDVDYLSAEFVRLYNMDPLTEADFIWGNTFLNNLDNVHKGKVIRSLVITEDFNPLTIKNWPVRLGQLLLRETEEYVMKIDEIKKRSTIVAKEGLKRQEGCICI